jgi:hypothetical protein
MDMNMLPVQIQYKIPYKKGNVLGSKISLQNGHCDRFSVGFFVLQAHSIYLIGRDRFQTHSNLLTTIIPSIIRRDINYAFERNQRQITQKSKHCEVSLDLTR